MFIRGRRDPSSGLGGPGGALRVSLGFSVAAMQRKAITPSDFTDLEDLATRILAFQDRYNATATPFDWTYTREDLNAFLKRLSDHDPQPEINRAA